MPILAWNQGHFYPPIVSGIGLTGNRLVDKVRTLAVVHDEHCLGITSIHLAEG